MSHTFNLTLFQYHTFSISHTSNLTLFQSQTLPISHCFNLTLFQSHTIQISHSSNFSFPISHTSNFTYFQSHTLPTLYSSNLTLFLSHTLPISHSFRFILNYTDLGEKKLWIISYILYVTYKTCNTYWSFAFTSYCTCIISIGLKRWPGFIVEAWPHCMLTNAYLRDKGFIKNP